MSDLTATMPPWDGAYCSNDECICATPGPVCDEFMGEKPHSRCPRCGWRHGSAERRGGPVVTAMYVCWCDGSACDGRTVEPFTVCDECRRLGHSPLPRMGLSPKDVEALDSGSSREVSE